MSEVTWTSAGGQVAVPVVARSSSAATEKGLGVERLWPAFRTSFYGWGEVLAR